jgi:hypothetical protein
MEIKQVYWKYQLMKWLKKVFVKWVKKKEWNFEEENENLMELGIRRIDENNW